MTTENISDNNRIHIFYEHPSIREYLSSKQLADPKLEEFHFRNGNMGTVLQGAIFRNILQTDLSIEDFAEDCPFPVGHVVPDRDSHPKPMVLVNSPDVLIFPSTRVPTNEQLGNRKLLEYFAEQGWRNPIKDMFLAWAENLYGVEPEESLLLCCYEGVAKKLNLF